MSYDFTVPSLGKSTVKSPISLSKAKHGMVSHYVNDDEYIIYNIITSSNSAKRQFKKKELLEKM